MILQELTTFYKRLLENPDIDICEPGFSKENISFKIVIDNNGHFKSLQDLRVMSGKNVVPVKIAVPKFDGKRARGIKPYFLWDKSDYLFGIKKEDETPDGVIEKETSDQHDAFIKLIATISDSEGCSSSSLDAVKTFCTTPEEILKLRDSELWGELLGSFVIFQNEDDSYNHIFEDSTILEAWRSFYAKSATGKKLEEGLCLVSGEIASLTTTLPTVKKGVGGKNDVPLVSCNIDSGESYGKKKGANAGIASSSASYFTGALNYLVDTKRHHLKTADAVTVFWAEENSVAEDFFCGLCDSSSSDDGHSVELEIFLKQIEAGKMPKEFDDDSKFYVLGLSPNAARISVRFWHTLTVRDMASKLITHFHDLSIVKQNKERDANYPSMWQLLIETASLHKSENIPPNISGPLMKAILSGSKYPSNILSILIGRMRTDQEYRRLNYYRASFIKAILNRNFNKELQVALDTERTTVPYCLGRLFSVLEKTQEDSSGGSLNTTIKDRYFASASTTPKIVFPVILKLAQNHLKKLKSSKPGAAVNKEKLIGEIVRNLENFPATLKLDEQGEFAIGYYHQRQDFFTSHKNDSEETKGDN